MADADANVAWRAGEGRAAVDAREDVFPVEQVVDVHLDTPAVRRIVGEGEVHQRARVDVVTRLDRYRVGGGARAGEAADGIGGTSAEVVDADREAEARQRRHVVTVEGVAGEQAAHPL